MKYFRGMEKLHVRNAILDDLHILLAFEQELIKAERPFDPTIEEGTISYYDLGDFIARDDVKVLVAEIDGEIVGSGYAYAKRARHYLDHEYYGYLGFMYTKPSHRGKGVNQKIVEELKVWCRSQNLNEIRLTVYEDNHAALKAYEKVGFKKHLCEMRIVSSPVQ